MNLGQIRKEISDALSFDPTSPLYDESIVRRVNNVYRQLCAGAPWRFLQREVDYTVIPNLDGSEKGLVVVFLGDSFIPSYSAQAEIAPGSDYSNPDQKLQNIWEYYAGAEIVTPAKYYPAYVDPFAIDHVSNYNQNPLCRRVIGATDFFKPGPCFFVINQYEVPKVNVNVKFFVGYWDENNKFQSLIKNQPTKTIGEWNFSLDTSLGAEIFTDTGFTGTCIGTSGGTATVDYATGEVQFTLGGLGTDPIVKTVQCDLIIKRRRWPLPPDCVDLLGIVNRKDEYGPLAGLSQWDEHQYPLYESEISTPVAYILDGQSGQEFRGDLQERGNYTSNSAPGGAGKGQLAVSRPPDVSEVTFTGTTGVTHNPDQLDPNATYEYMFTYASCGLETGPSDTISVSPGAPNDQFLYTPPLVKQYADRYEPGTPPVAETMGVWYNLYRRRQPSELNGAYGAWYKVTAPNFGGWSPGPHSPNVTPASPVVEGMSEENLVERYVEPLPTQFIRFFPSPDATYRFRMRYHYQPPLLEEDRDVSHIPQEYDSLLVHLVVEQIAAQADGEKLANHHARLASELLDKMRRRYLTSRSSTSRRRLWGTKLSFLIKPRVEFLP